ncbi:MAG: sialidase family protein [Armatimonadota bacterium]
MLANPTRVVGTLALGVLLVLPIATHSQEPTAMNSENTSSGELEEPALQLPLVNVAPGPEYADSTRIFQGIPGLERAPGGRLWATWYSGGDTEGPLNYVLLVTSGDNGRTWSSPRLVIDPPGSVRAFDPCLWHDPGGRLWLFWAQSYSWFDGRAGVWAIVTEESGSENPTWSAPRRLCDGVMMNKPVVLSTGEWVLPAAVWQVGLVNLMDCAFCRDPGGACGTNAVASSDHGETWEILGQADVPGRACDEHHIVERRDGSLWMLVRTNYGVGESFSTDRGRTWTPGRQSSTVTHIPSARFFVRRLQSGRLLLVKHDPPDGKTRSHLTAYLSEDEGELWQGGLRIDEREGVSYPDGVESPEGVVYIIYDYSRTGAKQILMATFTEADILDGSFASDRACSRILVNQATGVAPNKP